MSQPTQTKTEAIPTRRRASVRVALPGATAVAGMALLRWYIAEIVTERHVRWHGAGRRRFLRAHRRGEGGGTPPRAALAGATTGPRRRSPGCPSGTARRR